MFSRRCKGVGVNTVTGAVKYKGMEKLFDWLKAVFIAVLNVVLALFHYVAMHSSLDNWLKVVQLLVGIASFSYFLIKIHQTLEHGKTLKQSLRAAANDEDIEEQNQP